MYARPIQQLIDALTKLPSVGQRTAERFVFYLLKSGKKDVGYLTVSLKQLIDEVKSCETCWDFSDSSPCYICKNTARNNNTICVIAEHQDLQTIERTGTYSGLYHVLRGLIRPEREDDMRFLKIKELLKRAKDKQTKEVILALSPDMPGETTMMFLERKLSEINPELKITRLARGLPMGSDLQYADETTLSSALKHRTSYR